MIRTITSYCVLWLALIWVSKTLTQTPPGNGTIPPSAAALDIDHQLPVEEWVELRTDRRLPEDVSASFGPLTVPSLAMSSEGTGELSDANGSVHLDDAVSSLASDDWRYVRAWSFGGTGAMVVPVVALVSEEEQPSLANNMPVLAKNSSTHSQGTPRLTQPANLPTSRSGSSISVVVEDSEDSIAGPATRAKEPRAGEEPKGAPPEQDAAQLQQLGKTVADQSAPQGPMDNARASEEPQASAVLTDELLSLRNRIRDVLAYHIQRPEAIERRSPWGVMHALIAFGVDTEVTVSGRTVNAIGWLCWNGPCRGQQLMYLDNGELRLRVGPGVQGHEGQFLAMLAQSRVRRDYPIRVDGQSFTVQDLIEYEKRTCRPGTELTFKLIGLAHYLDTDEQWKSARGETWDLPRLIREELAQPVIGAACGGTHRMMGFSYAVRKRERSGRPVTGQWLRARKYVDDYHEYTFKLQNPDGSFSTNWFAGPGAYGTAERKLETTGHILEWLVYSLPQEQLTDPRVVKAVMFLTDLMRDNLEYEWEIGPRGHALHALAIYDERLFGGQPGQRRLQLAQHGPAADSR